MFDGFTPEAIDFLWGIRMNNNRDWFQSHKQQYTHALYEPMKALGQMLFQNMRDKPGNILKVSRIYRDARLHHPDPYKESLWICIRRDVAWWAESPCLFFEILPEGVSYGLLWWKPRASALEAFRNTISAQPDTFLRLMDSVQTAVGVPVTAEKYKRPRDAGDPRLTPCFAWKDNIACIRQEPVSEDIFGPALGERVRDFLGRLYPLYDYLNTFSA